MNNTIDVEKNPFFLYDMDKICIVCNHKLTKQPIYSIFDEVANTDSKKIIFNVLELFSNFKEITITKGPHNICEICYNNTIAALRFRNICNKSVSYLESYYKHQKELQKKLKKSPLMNTSIPHEANLITPEANNIKPEVINIDNDYNIILTDNSVNLKLRKQSTTTDPLNVKCEVCHKYYKSYYIKMHMRVHTGERPHRCKHCDKRSSTDLKKYDAGVHSDVRAFLCNTCGKSFKIQSQYYRHSRLHSDERPYKCKICGKGFKALKTLNNHTVVHSDEKPFTCEVCGKCFSLRKHLRQHMISHQEVKRHQCHLCGNRFTQAHSLRTHLSNHCKGGS